MISGLPPDQGINGLVTSANPERIVYLELPHPELATRSQYSRNTRPLAAARAVDRDGSPLRRGPAAGRATAEIEVEIPLPTTVADLRLALAMQHTPRWPVWRPPS